MNRHPPHRATLGATLLAALIGGAIGLGSAPAAAQPAPPSQLRLGIFAPNSRFTSGSAFRYITALARHVQRVTSIPTVGRSYRSAGAFRRAMGRLHFAVVDPIFLCRQRLAVVATGRLGGSARASWGLYARTATTIGGLKGRRLALAASGMGDVSFAEGMIGGRLKIKGFFSKVVYRKDLRSAINAVKAGQAEAVLAPTTMAKGLRKIFASPRVPNAGLAQILRLPPALARKVTRAIRGHGASGVGGWGSAVVYRCPFGRVRYPMALIQQRPVAPATAGMIRRLQPGKGYRLPTLLGLFRAK